MSHRTVSPSARRLLNIASSVPTITLWTLVAVLAAFAFGGASRLNEVRVTLVVLCALPLLALSVAKLLQNSEWRDHRFALTIIAATAAIPLAQLLPLPQSMWTSFPGREEIAPALALQAGTDRWIAFSLTPAKTWQSALALIPPVAVFLAAYARTPGLRRLLLWTILAGATLSIGLGMLQFAAQGRRFYLWPTTDAGSVAGLFANRNHLATLCLMTIPFAAVMFALSSPQAIARRWILGLFLLLAVAAIALIRSRTGILLAAPTLLASAVAAWIAAGRPRPGLRSMLIAGGGLLLVVLISVFAASANFERFNADDNGGNRLSRWPLVAETAQRFLPLGSGVGSFDPVYRSVEPLDDIDPTFFNQAHNDYLETWLETGWLGIAAILAFLFWYGRRALKAWRQFSSPALSFQRAASIAIMVVLLHSAIDYPLRTLTISVLIAFCCSVLEFADVQDQRSRRSRRAS